MKIKQIKAEIKSLDLKLEKIENLPFQTHETIMKHGSISSEIDSLYRKLNRVGV